MMAPLSQSQPHSQPQSQPQPQPSAVPTLPAATRLGPVALTVSNLERSAAFYQSTLGFTLHRKEAARATLGAGGTDLLILYEDASAPRKSATRGLFHVAYLVPSRAALARALLHFIEQETPLQGLSDHFVSEAIYLGDPDGLGIEVYRDRPRTEWEYDDGILNIGTVAMDARGVLNTLRDQPREWQGLEPGTTVGHMHMHVPDVAHAEHFYRETLGFDLITRFSHFASFLAAGGYHHHIAVRHGTGLPPAPGEGIGLRWYTILLPDAATRDALAARLGEAGVPARETPDGLIYADPGNNGFRLGIG